MKRQHYNRLFLAILATWMMTRVAFAQNSEQEQKNKQIAQVTFVAPVGSNGIYSANYINHFSLNVLVGVSGGVDGLELGGLQNITQGSVSGLQLAGIGNFATGSLRGVQMAGMFNTNQKADGLMASGIANVTSSSARGALLSGIANVGVGKSSALMVSGITNVAVAGNHGLQISGIANYNGHAGKGTQMAGIANVNLSSTSRFQLAGILNYNKNCTKGAQLAGIANYTKSLDGFQLGLINVADTLERGVPLGLLSVVRHGGYRAFELESTETFWANATFKMGVPKLYNIFTAGFTHEHGRDYWTFGLGLGSVVPIGKTIGLNIDLTSSHINEEEWWTNDLNLLNRLKLNLWIDAGPLTLFGGASLNVYVTNLVDAEGNIGGSLINPNNNLYDRVHGTTRTIIYPGYNFGIRF
jgi:hypothetical protein